VRFSCPSPEEGIDFWERTNPPLIALKTIAAGSLPAAAGRGRQHERALNAANDGSLVLDSEYLSVVAKKASR